MIRERKFVVDDTVLEFFAGRSRPKREDLLRIFARLAGSPYQKRFGRWLVRYRVDDPVLEVRILDVERVVP